MINPVIVKKSFNKRGKKVLIISGVHGDELSPIELVKQLYFSKDHYDDIKEITYILGINLSGIKAGKREVQIDKNYLDINRGFNNDLNMSSTIDLSC